MAKDANQTDLQAVKQEFLELLLYSRVLQFGSFRTKSGRDTPFFFNTGLFSTGRTIAAVAKCYATLIAHHFGREVTNLFGPAYKGIPLCAVTSAELAARLGRDIGFTFNRKEAKDHGEGGQLVGASYKEPQNVVVIEDVMTGGTSVRETMRLLQDMPVKVLGVVIGVDRQEKGLGLQRASAEITKDFGLPVRAILTLDEILAGLDGREVLGKKWLTAELRVAIEAYRAQYGGGL